MAVHTSHNAVGDQTADGPATGGVSARCTWPNFFVVGSMKCGTTSLWAHLRKHPQVFLPDLKEPHFFVSKVSKDREGLKAEHFQYPENQDNYLALYRNAKGIAAVGDATPVYMYDEKAVDRIRAVCPRARIIFILRDPVARAHSHYLMNRRDGHESCGTFAEAIAADRIDRNVGFFGRHLYVEMGLYYEPVKRYIDAFGRGQVLVILLDDLLKDPEGTMLKVTRHLGIDPLDIAGEALREARNAFKIPRFGALYRFVRRVFPPHVRQKVFPGFIEKWLKSSPVLYRPSKPAIDPELQSELERLYEPDIAKLEDLLGRKLPELRRSWITSARGTQAQTGTTIASSTQPRNVS